MIKLTLPWPPSINHYWRRAGYRIYISKGGREYRKKVVEIVRARKVKPLRGDLKVLIIAYPPDRRRRDADNLQKALLDAAEHGGLYEDDSQIHDLSIKKMKEVVPGGKIVMHVEEIGGG